MSADAILVGCALGAIAAALVAVAAMVAGTRQAIDDLESEIRRGRYDAERRDALRSSAEEARETLTRGLR